jgi:hypothetical protein
MESPAFRSALKEFVEEEKRQKLEYLRDMVRQQSPQATRSGRRSTSWSRSTSSFEVRGATRHE